MSLIQILEEGFDNGEGVDDWHSLSRIEVGAGNRRRILDREAKCGVTPDADGWLYMRRDFGTFVHVQRIKWVDAKWFGGAL